MVWIAIGFFNFWGKGSVSECKDVLVNISVVIPVRNEETNIIQCLQSLKDQNYDHNHFEVMIVNDHSTDGTVAVITNYIKENNLEWKLLFLEDKTSKKEALKLGIDNASNDVIATTDADCILPGNWLRYIADQFNQKRGMLLGPVMFKQQKGFLVGFQVLDMLAIQGVEFGALNYNKPVLNNAANLAYNKQDFNEVSGFDDFNTPSGDDIFLLEKFKLKKEIRGILTQDFIVETEPMENVSTLIQQRIRWSSKAKYYSDGLLLYFSAIVLLQNISLLFIYFGIPLVEKYRLILIILVFCKWLIDFILLFLVASFFKRRKVLFYFIPVQIVYPLYIVFTWFASISGVFEWKGRMYNE